MELENRDGVLNWLKLQLNIEQKNNYVVRSLLINDTTRKATDFAKRTPLHFASRSGNTEIVQYLIDCGVNVDAQDILGQTPLLLAVLYSKSIDTIATLLKANADFLIMESSGSMNALKWVVQLEKGPILEMFFHRLQEYCRDDFSMMADLLMTSKCSMKDVVKFGNSTIIEMMIKAGSDVNAVCPVSHNTALHLAAERMEVEIVKVLIEYGADATANIRDTSISPLTAYLRSGKRNQEIMQLLMREYFADVDKHYQTSLSLLQILYMGDEEEIRYALQYDVDLFTTDSSNNGVLHYLACNSNPNVTEPFQNIIDWIDVNRSNIFGHSPLYLACLNCNPSTVQFLLDNGADVAAKSNMGATPLAAVIVSNNNSEADEKKVVEILLRHGADVQVIWETRSQNFITVFDVVVEKGKFDLGELLMARLGFLEKLEKPIVDLIRRKIDDHKPLKNQYDLCTQQLEKMKKTIIYGSITLFHLLIKSEDEIARCQAYNRELLAKLEKFDIDYCSSSYYYNTLRDRISSALQKIRLINDATDVIINHLAPQLNSYYLVRNIMDNLEYEDMKVLKKIKF